MRSQVITVVWIAILLFGFARVALYLSELRRRDFRRRLIYLAADSDVHLEPISSQTVKRPLLIHRRAPSRLFSLNILSRLETALAATGQSVRIRWLILSAVIPATAIGGVLITAHLPLSIAVASAIGTALSCPLMLIRIAQHRYRRQFLEVFPEALDMIVRAVKAGLPAMDAMDLSSREVPPPVGAEFQRILDEIRIGVDMEEALKRTAGRIRIAEFHFFVVCLILQRRAGGGLADVLSNLSQLIRHRRMAQLKALAITAETRVSATLLAIMPLAAGVGVWLINKQLMLTMFIDSRGRTMLFAAALMLLAGTVIIRYMIRRSVS